MEVDRKHFSPSSIRLISDHVPSKLDSFHSVPTAVPLMYKSLEIERSSLHVSILIYRHSRSNKEKLTQLRRNIVLKDVHPKRNDSFRGRRIWRLAGVRPAFKRCTLGRKAIRRRGWCFRTCLNSLCTRSPQITLRHPLCMLNMRLNDLLSRGQVFLGCSNHRHSAVLD